MARASNLKHELNNGAAALNAALDQMEAYGKIAAKANSEAKQARYDAAVSYGDQVKIGVATVNFNFKKDKIADSALKFVQRYQKGAGGSTNADSLKTLVSNFRAFAFKEAIERQKEIEKAVKAHMAGKSSKQLGSKDLFAIAYGVNSKLRSCSDKGEAAPALETLVKEIGKPKAKPAAKDPGKAKADTTPADEYVSAQTTIVEAATILNTFELTPAQQKAVDALLALKW